FARGDEEGAYEDLSHAADLWAQLYADTPADLLNGRTPSDEDVEEIKSLLSSCRFITVENGEYIFLGGTRVEITLAVIAATNDDYSTDESRLGLWIMCQDASQHPDDQVPGDHLRLDDIPLYLEIRGRTKQTIPGSISRGKIRFRDLKPGTVGKLR